MGKVRKLKGKEMSLYLSEMSCSICGDDRSNRSHYGAHTCWGCRDFFRSSVRKNKIYQCKKDKKCVIDRLRRNECQFCRFSKCLAAGMKRQAVQMTSVHIIKKLSIDKNNKENEKTINVEEEKEKRNEDHHSFKVFPCFPPPSPKASITKSIKLEPLSPSSAPSVSSLCNSIVRIVDSEDNSVDHNNASAAANESIMLMQTIELSKEEVSNMEKEIQIQEKLIDKLNQTIEKEKEMLNKMRLQRNGFR